MKLRHWMGALAALALGGCATNPRDNVAFYQDTYSELSPVARPQRVVTSFSDSLACMDVLLREAHLPVTLVATKAIPDASGLVQVAAKDMVITTLAKMSHTSNAFRVVDYEVDPLKQDSVQNLTSLLLNAGQINIFKPAIYISGGISHMEKNTRGKRRDLGVSGRDLEFGLTRELLASVLGLELHMGDFGTRTLIPGVYSSNELSIGLAGGGVSSGGRLEGSLNGKIYKAGVQFEASNDVTLGLGVATRTLIELGLIELVGRWARVPYWQCLAVEQAHPEVQRELYAWFRDLSTSDRIRELQTGLGALSYYGGAADGNYNSDFVRALRSFQADRRLVPTGTATFESYEALLRQYVTVDGDGKFKRVGWSEPRDVGGSSDGRLPPPLAITLPKADPSYSIGESVFFNVVSDRSRYVFCYYQDSAGAVSRVFPSQFQPASLVEGRRSLLVPNIFDPNTFSLEMGAPGQQAVMCLGSDTDLLAKVGTQLSEPPLAPMRSATSLEQVLQTFTAAASGQPVAQQTARWSVVPAAPGSRPPARRGAP